MVILMLNQWFIKGRELNHLIACGCICVCVHAQVRLCKGENLHACFVLDHMQMLYGIFVRLRNKLSFADV